MRTELKAVLVGLVLACAIAQSHAAAHTHARLLLSAESARPGEEVLAGIELKMDPDWHTYWNNPGQSGIATTISWELPPGISAGETGWPVPKKTSESGLTTYGYEGEVVLLVPLKIAANASGKATLKAKVTWLECDPKSKCVPGAQQIDNNLDIGNEAKLSKDAEFLVEWKKRLPKSRAGLNARGTWQQPPAGNSRSLILEWNSSAPDIAADFFPEASDSFEVQPATQKLASEGNTSRLKVEIKKSSGAWPAQLSGLIVEGQGTAETAYEVKIPITDSAATPSTRSASAPAPLQKRPIVLMLVYAFLGGLILNVMPCVLPVIALKILGFVSDAQHEPKKVRKFGLIYTLGILCSFLALALLTLALKAAGHAAGWGFQFGNPYFLVVITTLVTLIALNLFGVFEITLSSGALTAANQFASRQGAAGAFFNGLLATVLATSCTAPVLGIALGYASSLNNGILLTIFWLTVGLGLAMPYLILSFQPAWLRWLPKPGPWMQRFKVAMGFPMVAAAVWLCSILEVHYGDRTWWMVAFLVFVAVAAWIFGEFVQRGSRHRVLAGSLAIGLLVVAYGVALEQHLEWRKPLSTIAANPNERSRVAPKGLAWQPWTPQAVAAARSAGHPVIVDFTATWCPNCNIVVKPALENNSVQKKLREVNAALLVADYSLFPNSITQELQRFQRDGVPMVLVYPPNPDAQPIILDLPGSGALLKAIDQATRM